MPGPKSTPTLDIRFNADCTRFSGRRVGKTEHDRVSGKWARRLVNRHADPIRENGGKQFK
jgi:hypothetical protein